MTDVFYVLAAVVVGIFSAGRLTRLLVADDLPPIVWFRIKWDERTDESGWNKLFHCHFCMSFWMTALVFFTGYFSNWHELWWIANGLFAASYAVAMLVERDEA